MNLTIPPLPPGGASESPAADDLAHAFALLMRTLHLRQGGAAEDADRVALAAWYASRATSAGHACASLAESMGDSLPQAPWPFGLTDQQTWCEALARSPVVASGAAADAFRPLVLELGNRLYLRRYREYERALAERLQELSSVPPQPLSSEAAAWLDKLFPPRADGGDNLQKAAAERALSRRLTLITGGPGTGKTSTVVRIVALLLALEPGLRIALAAPTGKAAARMQESLRQQIEALPIGDEVKQHLPREAFTVHRLLGVLPEGVDFRHNRGNPLDAGLVVVDEASMLDLALAAKLADAIPAHGRLVLLGDADQLASVETGAVFASICAVGVGDAVVRLAHSYRFAGASGIGGAARCVNRGDVDGLAACLAAPPAGDLAWRNGARPAAELAGELIGGYADFLAAVGRGVPPGGVIAAFERYRVLTAVKEGPQGAAELNAALTARFRAELGEAGPPARWFRGRPVLVTRNDYLLRLFNGDVGVALPGPDGDLLVHFPAAEGGTRAIAPGRLPEAETAFAMTVHKAQGSEFERLDVVLPARDARVLTRELVYTALTRARAFVRLWAPREILAGAVARRTVRHSGLADRLTSREP